jgi:hypothetical protein
MNRPCTAPQTLFCDRVLKEYRETWGLPTPVFRSIPVWHCFFAGPHHFPILFHVKKIALWVFRREQAPLWLTPLVRPLAGWSPYQYGDQQLLLPTKSCAWFVRQLVFLQVLIICDVDNLDTEIRVKLILNAVEVQNCDIGKHNRRFYSEISLNPLNSV